ncbi:MAG: gamma-glutamyl-gamma-aminobutyrate hydrolase family protein [Gemmatimonadaceae bacterium]|nr:gamma-glutamyl-gamma-aminobutyrate hydrolase family protein [Gemmatimonadaceae bacterium]
MVAVTATTRSESSGEPPRVRLNAAYVDAVARAGGVPVVVPVLDPALAASVLAPVRALIVTGGEDVAPDLFGEEPRPGLGRVVRARDVWEIALIHAARDRALPVFGVCRGIQVLNVALGGTLLQDIPRECPGALVHHQPEGRDVRSHPVACLPGSRLARLVGEAATVNSMHHQAIARVAPGLTVTATAPDGMIEGVEWHGTDWWAVGVQWHPEELDGRDAALFSAVVEAAAR